VPARLIRNGETIEVHLGELRGSSFYEALDKTREINGRRWNAEKTCWDVEATAENAERLVYGLQAEVDDEFMEWMREKREQQQIDLTTPLPKDAKLLVPWANKRCEWQPKEIQVGDEWLPFNGLDQHQRPAVELLAREKRGILADDPGLGKTGTVISTVEEYRLRNKPDGFAPSGPRLVIAPNSVTGAWMRELRMWLGADVPAIHINATTAKARHNQVEKALDLDPDVWVVVNWEQIRAKKTREERRTRTGGTRKITIEQMKEPLFEKTEWLLVCADECHHAKNRNAQVTRGLWRVQNMVLGIGTSGTPVMNRPDELWSQLAWLYPDDYHERGAAHSPGARAFWTFYEAYTDYQEGYWGKEIVGVKNPDALRFELRNRVTRRTQDQVLNLPGKVRRAVSIDLNPKQRKLYDEAEKAMWLEVEQAAAKGDKEAEKMIATAGTKEFIRLANGATRTVRLRQILETPATLGAEDDSAVLDDCVQKITDSQPSQWVVFCAFKPTVECAIRRLTDAGLIAEPFTGDVSTAQRTKLEDAYQRGEVDVVVGTIDALYQGITLTAGHRQYWCSRHWNPERNRQGEDRQNRRGQQKRVIVFIAQPDGTVVTGKVNPTNRLKERIVRTIMPQDAIEEETC
jgi:SNF2 family DNA or RNA helicase